jgi:hypothetical protein
MSRPRDSERRASAITPATLVRAPHLAVLDVIDHAFGTAAWALLADYPGLVGDPHPGCHEPPDQLAARRLLRQMHTFERALARYRRALLPLLEPATSSPIGDDDIDF